MASELVVYSLNQRAAWEDAVGAIPHADVYWMPGYLAPLQWAGHGAAKLAVLRVGDHRLVYAFLERETPDANGHRDIVTPYGYGGPLVSHGAPAHMGKAFRQAFGEYARERRIISEFVRFHPILDNAHVWAPYMDTSYDRPTYGMALHAEQDLFAHVDSKSRNMIRKSEKNEVCVTISDDQELISTFINMYYASMDHNQASAFYYFQEDFFRRTMREMPGRSYIAQAEIGGQVVAASLLLVGQEFLHYHFSGMDRDFRQYGVQNRLLYEAARWGQAKGLKAFHLGGGVSADDSLARFKQSMASARYSFFVGRCVHDPELYASLVQKREAAVGPLASGFFPAYRAPQATA